MYVYMLIRSYVIYYLLSMLPAKLMLTITYTLELILTLTIIYTLTHKNIKPPSTLRGMQKGFPKIHTIFSITNKRSYPSDTLIFYKILLDKNIKVCYYKIG